MIDISVSFVVYALQFQAESECISFCGGFEAFSSHLMLYSSLGLRPVTFIFKVGNILLKILSCLRFQVKGVVSIVV